MFTSFLSLWMSEYIASINWIAVFGVSVLSWVAGAIWYGPIFGRIWMKIHHSEKTDSKPSTDGMGTLLFVEFLMTFLMIAVLAFLMTRIPDAPGFRIAILVWLGFVFPSATSTILWGKDEKKCKLQDGVPFSKTSKNIAKDCSFNSLCFLLENKRYNAHSYSLTFLL